MPDLGCGAKCAKYILFLINLIFSIIGLILFGVGIFVVVDVKLFHNKYMEIVGFSNDLMLGSAVVIVVVGVVILFVAMVGCIGASRENSGCLSCYSVLVGLLILLQIVAVIMAAAFYNQIIGSLTDTMLNQVKYHYGEDHHNDTTIAIDYIQFGLKCCGVDSKGPLNWQTSAWHNETGQSVPLTCCTSENSTHDKVNPVNQTLCLNLAYNETVSKEVRSKYVYTEGCEAKVDQWIKHYVGIVIGVVIAFVIIQLAFVVVACLLKSSVSSRYEYV